MSSTTNTKETSKDTISKKSLITYRDYKDSDRNMILATWLNGLYLGSSYYALMDKTIFYESYDPILKRILSDESAVIKLAVLREDDDIILGYAVLKMPNILHYVYVKAIWRRIGIMSDLLKQFSMLDTVTHLTELGKKLKPEAIYYKPIVKFTTLIPLHGY